MKTIAEFVEAYRAGKYWWEPLDRPIIRMCRECNKHVTVKDVFAKVAMVNRVYRTNLQMATINAEWKVAARLVAEGVDEITGTLARLGPFGHDTLADVVRSHERFVDIVRSITKRTENSFCSKYLSFHYPQQVVIFDNYAYQTSWDLCGRLAPKGLYAENWNVDYGYHCEAVILLLDALRSAGVGDPNIKLIDNVLYGDRDRA